MKNVRVNHEGKTTYFTNVESVQIMEDYADLKLVIYNREKGKIECHQYPIAEVDYFESYENPTFTLEELVPLIQQWFVERGIDKGDGEGQLTKLQEEVEELLDAHDYGDAFEIRDAVGDIIVVLIGYCLQTGLDIVQCLEGAYNEIKNRTGKVDENGVFVKDE